MTLDAILFLILAATIAVSAVGVVLTSSIIRSAMWLLITLIGVSFLYFLLGAEFLGAAQLIVYVGGTLVLLVFGGMLTSGGPFRVLQVRMVEWLAGSVVALTIFGLLTHASLQLGSGFGTASPEPVRLPSTGMIGLSFLGVPESNQSSDRAFLLPFEIVSIHLLVVLIGAAYLARARRSVNTTS